MARRVFITVAEVSGDKHAAQLIRALRELDPELVIDGLGGPEMATAGATIHHETVGKAAMTFHAVARVFEVLRLLKWTRNHFKTHRPDLQICVDSPAMNFHFAKVAREFGVPVFQFVAPQLWAWREGRMKKVRRLIDTLACILPFEEAYFRSHGVNATFVGHPLFDELPPRRDLPGPRFPQAPPVIGLLAGSRTSEAKANFPHQMDVARRIRACFPEAKFLAPTTAATHAIVAQHAAGFEGIEIAQDQFDQMVPQCDLCITVSGTATLHVAAHGVPMIVVYRVNPLAWNLAGRWLLKTRTFALVNVLAKPRPHIVPEIVPWYGSNAPVAEIAIDFLKHPEKLESQRQQLNDLVQTLDHPGASMNAAKLALAMLDESPRRH